MHWRVSVLTLAVLVLFLVSCKHHKRGMDSLRTVEGIYNAFNCAVRGTSLIFNAPYTSVEIDWGFVFFLFNLPLRILPQTDCEQRWEFTLRIDTFTFSLILQ